MPAPEIWTIGHSTRSIEDFLSLLQEYKIQTLADVRHYPGSRRYPHFNKPALKQSLNDANIDYEHLIELGGRRPPRPDSHNLVWRNPSFRGYADYMETQPFKDGIARLEKIARTSRTAIMCSEAVWWRCHRSMISDHLKSIGFTVLHILSPGKIQEHPYTSAAQIIDGKLSYASSLFTRANEPKPPVSLEKAKNIAP
jgi:uncharacterized protein (DUF488 family)